MKQKKNKGKERVGKKKNKNRRNKGRTKISSMCPQITLKNKKNTEEEKQYIPPNDSSCSVIIHVTIFPKVAVTASSTTRCEIHHPMTIIPTTTH